MALRTLLLKKCNLNLTLNTVFRAQKNKKKIYMLHFEKSMYGMKKS